MTPFIESYHPLSMHSLIFQSHCTPTLSGFALGLFLSVTRVFRKMKNRGRLMLIWVLGLLTMADSFSMHESGEVLMKQSVKTATFRSPPFALQPGDVQDKYYYGVPFPKGHIAIKSFDAEVVDEAGNSVPLHEVYLHHWVVLNFHTNSSKLRMHRDGSDVVIGNDGVCLNGLTQLFGLGSETRHTSNFLPEPYGIEVGNPDIIPEGKEEAWLLNVHAIDTRGTVDPSGCLECRCDLYNVTVDVHGHPLREGYIGGLFCCYDGTQCRVKDGFEGKRRTYYLQYTVKWLEWDESIVPVKAYIFDVTASGRFCKVEYDVPACDVTSHLADCIHIKESHMHIPVGGDVVYGAAHLHSGGIGATLYGEDGREICSSLPLYGRGSEAGNEDGYIVGMSTCYPKPGSVKVYTGEKVQLQSKYSRVRGHTGVMGIFYLLVDPNSKLTSELFQN